MGFAFARFATLLLALIHSSLCLPKSSDPLNAFHLTSTSQLRQTYDYIIVGGGASGLAVANRLTEDLEIDVLVIEYGYIDGQENGTSVPGLQAPERYSRIYTSIPQPGLNNRSSFLYTGAVVGGGTVVNGMFFNRGSAADYDAWEALGNPGWGWKCLLPYFKKSETFTPPSENIQNDFADIVSSDLSPHGTKGPVESSFSNYQYPVIHKFFQGWQSIGVKIQPQPNAGDANGAFYSPISLKALNQSRSSASDAYYRPVAGSRKNLHLLTDHLATKINFDKHLVATSVNIMSVSQGNTSAITKAKARREIVLAAGAVHSPQILQLSGIGPSKLLSSLGIDTLVDLPGVGQNFQDQPTVYMQYNYSKYPFPTPDWMISNLSWASEQLDLYYKNRTGPMTIPYFGGSTVAFLPLQNVTDDYQITVSSAAAIDLRSTLATDIDSTVLAGYRAQVKHLLELYKSPHAAVEEVAWGGGNTVCVAMIRPLSRGTIAINNTEPAIPPVVDFRTFAHPTDLDVAVKSLERVRDWMASPTMQDVGAIEVLPGGDVFGDQDLAATIRQLAVSSWQHPTSTCSMMPREMGGVVDSNLNVYGVTALRIVDASVFPMAVAGHTSSTVYAVAEKAADLIKEARKKKYQE